MQARIKYPYNTGMEEVVTNRKGLCNLAKGVSDNVACNSRGFGATATY